MRNCFSALLPQMNAPALANALPQVFTTAKACSVSPSAGHQPSSAWAAWAACAGRVSFVHNDFCPESFSELEQLADRARSPSILKMLSVFDHTRSTSLRVRAQHVSQEIQVTVRINDFSRT